MRWMFLLVCVACSSRQNNFMDDGGTDGAMMDGDITDSGNNSDFTGGPTFGTKCMGGATVTGTIFAPNGTDPLPNIYVYAASKVNPFPPGNYCNQCNMPLDSWYTHVQSAIDGTFSLDLANVPFGPDFTFVINVGRFRKVTKLSVKCGANPAPKAAGTLPGKSADGDIPKIAVSTGNVDHLDQILTDLGITEWDCFEGRANPQSNPTCMPKDTIAHLLNKTTTKIDDYHLLFVSCAPYAYAAFGSPTIASNLAGFVNAGGRVFATAISYDYVAQAFPSAITWMGPGGSPQPVDGANVGIAANYTGNIDDMQLLAWLKAIKVTQTNTVPLQGFLNPWSVQSSLPKTSTLVVDGTIKYDINGGNPTTGDVPLTTKFDVSTCGRVIYSSYHTAGGTAQNLLPQERILEYLMFEVGSCVGPPPPN